MPLKLDNRRAYPAAFIGISALLILGAFLFPYTLTPSILVSLVGALAALIYFLYSRHLDATKLFKELFVEFNARYDKLNEGLNRIRQPPHDHFDQGELSRRDKDTLCAYFNLCAEEWLFYQAGYIDGKVWQCWVRGMAFFARDPRVLRLWTEEVEQNSYYGFPLEAVERLVIEARFQPTSLEQVDTKRGT